MLRASLQLVRPLKAAGSIRLGLNATPFAVRMLGTKGVPSAAVPGQGHVTDTSNSTMFMRDDVGRKTLGVHCDTAAEDSPTMHRDPSNDEAPWLPGRMRNDREMGVLRENPRTHEPYFTREGEDAESDPHAVREAVEDEVRGERSALVYSLFPGANPHLTDFAEDRSLIVDYNLLGDPAAAAGSEANRNPNSGCYKTMRDRERSGR